MSFWLLTLSYWLHLLATVVWLGGLASTVIITLPAMRQEMLDDNLWLNFQRRLVPWVNVSLAVLLVTGFYQMTQDPNYGGFMVFDGIWAWSMLLKHIAFAGLVGLALYLQFSIFPEFERLALLARQKPDAAARQQAEVRAKEVKILWLSVIAAVAVLLFTAIMTAV